MSLSSLSNFRVRRDPRGVVAAELDVPGRTYNVLGEEVFLELESLCDELDREPAVRLVIFRGKESGFLAGADIRAMAALESREAAERFAAIGQRALERLERMGVPTVAVIHGPCLGGGLEVALACRYRLARDDENTRLGLPEVELGLVSAWGGTQRLPELIGISPAIEMIFSASRVSACRAAEIGLVDGAWPVEEFERRVEQFISDRLEGRPLARRRPGLRARLRDRTRLGQSFVLRAARRKIVLRENPSPARGEGESLSNPALFAAWRAVAEGCRSGREQGFRRERESFAELLFTPQARGRIEQFLSQRARK